MSEYQYIAIVHNDETEPVEEIVNETGETVEYFQTIVSSSSPQIHAVNNSDGEKVTLINIDDNNISVSTPMIPSVTMRALVADDEPINTHHEEETMSTIDSSRQFIIKPEGDEVTCNKNVNLKSIMLPLGIKITQEDQSADKRKRMKSSLFIGYTTEAASIVKEFEVLKSDLSIDSNLVMLRELIHSFRTRVITNTKSQITNQSSQLTKNQTSSVEFRQHSHTDTNSQHEILELFLQEQNDSNQQEDITDSSFSVQEESVTSSLFNTSDETNRNDQMTNVLGLTALNLKTIQLAKKYLDHLGKDGFYVSGFVGSSEKLDEFLKLFRLVTGSSYSIRRSKVKVNDDPDPEEKPLRKYKPGYLGKGQIKWEKNIGIPPIPFTGVPFTTEGTTTYQCIYGPKRVKLKQDGTDDDNENDILVSRKRPRSRESKKKDCPAQIHIRTIHRFSAFSCLASNPLSNNYKEHLQASYLNKCQRGIILAKLRESIVNGQVEGEQGFWIRVPLPEVHQNHSLGPFDGGDTPLNEETILEMKNILQNAAIEGT